MNEKSNMEGGCTCKGIQSINNKTPFHVRHLLGDSPGKAKAVIGAGASSKLINDNEGVDRCRLKMREQKKKKKKCEPTGLDIESTLCHVGVP